jgi:hypothetical protein
LNNVENIQRAVEIRLQVATFLNEGKLSYAFSALESSASIITTLAYDLCSARYRENTAGITKEFPQPTI